MNRENYLSGRSHPAESVAHASNSIFHEGIIVVGCTDVVGRSSQGEAAICVGYAIPQLTKV